MRQQVVRMLKPQHAFAVENPVLPGTPDVNCTLGWIELKSVDKPKRETSKVNLDHFTAQQRVFLMKRWKAEPGSAWLLVKCGDIWLLYRGDDAATKVAKEWKSYDDLYCNAEVIWEETPSKGSLAYYVMSFRDND